MDGTEGATGTMVDLFCGCGGFSLGAELAGFRSVAAVDVDPTLQSSYRRNFPRSRAVQASVADLDRSDWSQLIGKVRPDLLIGGPPCQGFSRIGRRRENDPRNNLIHHFYRHVGILRPKVFVMENVEGILDAEMGDVLAAAMDTVRSRYNVVGPFLVNAADYGAATNRRRVVVVGYDPADVDPITAEMFRPNAVAATPTVRDAIADLPGPQPSNGDKDDFGWSAYAIDLQEPGAYAKRMRKPAPYGLGWTEALTRHAGGFVSGVVSTVHDPDIADRYAAVQAGRCDPITKSYRLDWAGQCPTLRAGTGADKGAFQAVRPLHPGEGRVITVREAARLQAFPDWFTFHQTKWHSFRMIGNSVSPAMSEGLLRIVARAVKPPLAA